MNAAMKHSWMMMATTRICSESSLRVRAIAPTERERMTDRIEYFLEMILDHPIETVLISTIIVTVIALALLFV
jgi:hypothetical protein